MTEQPGATITEAAMSAIRELLDKGERHSIGVTFEPGQKGWKIGCVGGGVLSSAYDLETAARAASRPLDELAEKLAENGIRGSTPSPNANLTDLASNRILYALALLGVVLPLNALASHYHQVGFIYAYTHRSPLMGPVHWHFRAVSFFYSMEALLAIAVYFYGLHLLMRWHMFERWGTAFCLLAFAVPIFYGYLYGCAQAFAAINPLHSTWRMIALIVFAITLFLFGLTLAFIYLRLEGLNTRTRKSLRIRRSSAN